MYKVMTIVGTRPEIIKMSRVIAAFDRHTRHILVHTGQNFDYELNEIFFRDLGIRKPDHFLGAAGDTPAQTIARVIEAADRIFEIEKPDALLLYGDTNSCLSVIAAKRRKIPVFHMEAGNRCFDQRVPEELNRKVVDHLSDVNIVLTEHARRYLLAEGLPAERIFKSGSHMQEILAHYEDGIAASPILQTLELTEKAYFLVSLHREENVDLPEKLDRAVQCLEQLCVTFDRDIVVSTHPRTRKRLESLDARALKSERIRFLKPFGFFDYIALQKHAFCILSDSGTIAEEASLLDLPAITIRDAHERPEGMDEGTLPMSAMEPSRLVALVGMVTEVDSRRGRKVVGDYQGGAVSLKILNIVVSYIEYVNSVVWRKSASV